MLNPWKKFNYSVHGNPNAKAMIISEAPGSTSICIGQMWKGAGGARLRRVIRHFSKDLEDVFYMTDTVKCLPPDNRDPVDEEINNCSEYLLEEIEIVKPTVILSFGRFALDYLSFRYESIDPVPEGTITELHNDDRYIVIKFINFNVIPLLHPTRANQFMNYDVYKKHVRNIFSEIIEFA